MHAIKGRRVVQNDNGEDMLEFLVQYGAQYLNEEPSWQLVENLAEAQELVEEYERLHVTDPDERGPGGGLT